MRSIRPVSLAFLFALVICVGVGCLVALGSIGLAAPPLRPGPVEGAKTRPPDDPTAPDNSRIMVVIEPSVEPSLKTYLEDALKRAVRRSGIFGGFAFLTGADPKTAAAEATEQRAGAIVHVKEMSSITDKDSQATTLTATWVISVPKAGKWTAALSGRMAALPSPEGSGTCDHLVRAMSIQVIAQLFPYKLTRSDPAKNTVEVSFKNTSPRKIQELTIGVPEGSGASWQERVAGAGIAPGEEKTVVFRDIPRNPFIKLRMDYSKAAVVWIQFEEKPRPRGPIR